MGIFEYNEVFFTWTACTPQLPKKTPWKQINIKINHFRSDCIFLSSGLYNSIQTHDESEVLL